MIHEDLLFVVSLTEYIVRICIFSFSLGPPGANTVKNRGLFRTVAEHHAEMVYN